MSRGRKKVIRNNSDWESVFYNSVGTYVQYINLQLAKEIKAEPLSKHIRIVGGYSFRSSEYKQQGVPVIRISDFNNEKIILDDVVYYDESEDLIRYELNEGDIVIALTGGTIAKLGIVQKGSGKLYLNQRVGKFEVLHPEEFETEYVYWIARSVQSIIKNLAWGAAIPNVSPKQIEELQFPIPDKQLQNGIIDFLNDLRINNVHEDKEYFNSEVEDLIFSLQTNQITGSELQSELNHQQDLIQKIRRSFLKEAMQGKLVKQDIKDGTTKELLQKIKAEKDILVSEKKLKEKKEIHPIKKEEIPFDLPGSWTWCTISEIVANEKNALKAGPFGSSLKKEFYVSKGYKIYGQEQVINQDPFFGDYFIDEELFLKLKSCQVSPGDILISLVGTMGKVLILPEGIHDGIINPRLVKISLHRLISREFIRWYLYSPVALEQIQHYSHGSTMEIINLGIICKLLIPVPPFEEQKRIVKKLEEVMNLCDELKTIITDNQNYTNQLLQVALKDALQMKELEVED